MEAGETMVEIIRSTPASSTPASSNVTTTSGDTHEGIKQYYIQKIEELQLNVAEKSQNLRRLQAKRNELNAKGYSKLEFLNRTVIFSFSSYVT